MKIIPLLAVPSQEFNIVLSGQSCAIKIYQKSTGLYFDLSVSNSPVVTGILCLDRVKLVRYSHLGFIGDLSFMDTQGTNAPEYTGLGDRFQLMYLETTDL